MEKLSRGIEKVINAGLFQNYGAYIDVENDQHKFCVLGGCALMTGYVNSYDLNYITGNLPIGLVKHDTNHYLNLGNGYGISGLLSECYFDFVLTPESLKLIEDNFINTSNRVSNLFSGLNKFFNPDINNTDMAEYSLRELAMYLNDAYNKSFEQILEIIKWCEDNLSYYQ